MRIILKDFEYQGYHFKEVEFELPNIKKLEDIDVDKLVEYIVWPLDTEINWNESFEVKGS